MIIDGGAIMADETRQRAGQGGAAGGTANAGRAVGEQEADAFAADVAGGTDHDPEVHGADRPVAGAPGGGTGIGDLAGGTGIGTDDAGGDSGDAGAGDTGR